MLFCILSQVCDFHLQSVSLSFHSKQLFAIQLMSQLKLLKLFLELLILLSQTNNLSSQ